MYRPSFEEFCRLSREGNLIPVSREILADMETPVSAFRKIDSGEYAFLLESVQGGEKWARYSFLGSHPLLVVRTKGARVELLRGGEVQPLPMPADPLALLKAQLAPYRPVRVPGSPRFFGGLVGYLGYDAARFFEKLPDATRDDLDLPDACFLFTDTLLIFDNLRQRITVVSNAHITDPSPDGLERAYEEAVQSIEAIVGELRKPVPVRPPASPAGPRAAPRSTLTREAFEEAVRRCKEYVRAGDIIQSVLSRRLEVSTNAEPFDIYRALRIINPSPYMYYLRLGDLRLVGSSPEVLVRLEEGGIDLRPIAGTRPRGRDEAEDRRLEQELLADPKERAEHIMLVDLGRNDVGRVAEVGSVEVNELMVTERYSHVMHIVSNVRARLRADRDAFDLLRACFPAGTVTGAPKIRAMEIIEELEPVKRGPYAGAVGYFSFSGNMDTCITIRTILCRPGRAYIQAGAGIVADSDPAREYQETASKAEAMLRAVAMAETGLEG
ncbi:MAG TPA: anthranilate synthase component I [Candidatus Methylomirabilis sp.]|jgi:anthranilate synthase component 1|nr:anthranilate synthase component I [Candidatus Methylomirabilis sp.]